MTRNGTLTKPTSNFWIQFWESVKMLNRSKVSIYIFLCRSCICFLMQLQMHTCNDKIWMSQYNTCSCVHHLQQTVAFSMPIATPRFFLTWEKHITTHSLPHLNCPLSIFAHGFGLPDRIMIGDDDAETQRWTKVAQVVGGSKCLPFLGKWGMGVETKYIKYMWIKPPTWDFGVSLAANLNMSKCQKRLRGWFFQVHSSQCSGLCPRHWKLLEWWI